MASTFANLDELIINNVHYYWMIKQKESEIVVMMMDKNHGCFVVVTRFNCTDFDNLEDQIRSVLLFL